MLFQDWGFVRCGSGLVSDYVVEAGT